jgi:hypothetical protein
MTIQPNVSSFRAPPARTTACVLQIAIEYLGKGQYSSFDATPGSPTYDKELVSSHTTEPFFASARVLVHQRHDPDAILEMVRRATPERVDMCGRLGTLAKLTVLDPANGSPRIVAWKPSPFDSIRKDLDQ